MKISLLVTLLGISVAFLWGGLSALSLVLILSVLEISLSFDNAVLNAAVLEKMDKVWQTRFLTWGILISVLLVRLLLPVIIVAIITHLTIIEVLRLAIINPLEYSKHVVNAKVSISAFGGMFLLLVFLRFVFDQKEKIYWFTKLEKKLSKFGTIRSLEFIVALLILICIQKIISEPQKLEVIIAGSVGIILFFLLNTLTMFLNRTRIEEKRSGIMAFLYLEILDASFSLDGVISAFAITKDIVIILIGLTIGAIFVRSLTILLVNKKTLQHYIFLEHGAHYAIGALSLIMLTNIFFQIPELLTGIIGIGFISLALLASIRHHRI